MIGRRGLLGFLIGAAAAKAAPVVEPPPPVEVPFKAAVMVSTDGEIWEQSELYTSCTLMPLPSREKPKPPGNWSVRPVHPDAFVEEWLKATRQR